MSKTKIDYLDYLWNPLAMRCTPCSPGCDHCWHLRMADRLKVNPKIDGQERCAYKGFCNPIMTKHLKDPLHCRKPSRIGVQFMGDLFHKSIHFRDIHMIFNIMKACPKHTFLLLTKRAARMNEVVTQISKMETLEWANGFYNHVWLGVTVCNQAEADEKISILLQTPAAYRWVSYEPALEAVNFGWRLHKYPVNHPFEFKNGLDWIVAGTETGKGGRPADNDWFMLVARQCRNEGVPFFMKKCAGSTPENLMIKELPWQQ